MHPYDLADALARLRDANGLSQRDLARETGKSEGEISKVLAILDLAPEVQKMAREDTEGRITRRHLYAVHALPADQQVALIAKARDEAINAEEMEQLVKQRAEAAKGPKRRGASGQSPAVQDIQGDGDYHVPKRRGIHGRHPCRT